LLITNWSHPTPLEYSKEGRRPMSYRIVLSSCWWQQIGSTDLLSSSIKGLLRDLVGAYLGQSMPPALTLDQFRHLLDEVGTVVLEGRRLDLSIMVGDTNRVMLQSIAARSLVMDGQRRGLTGEKIATELLVSGHKIEEAFWALWQQRFAVGILSDGTTESKKLHISDQPAASDGQVNDLIPANGVDALPGVSWTMAEAVTS